jgi:hypothetical protein
LEPSTTNFIHGTLAGLWLKMEEVAEEVEVVFYPQEGLIAMNKDRNMENRVGVEVTMLNAIIEKKAPEEIRSQKGQIAFNKILK